VKDMWAGHKIRLQDWKSKIFGSLTFPLELNWHHFIIVLLGCLIWILNSDLFIYSLTDMATHVLATYSFLRLFRVISFVSTIVPNQSITCQHRKFGHMVHPQSITELLALGFHWQTDGGCNDQIFSGHVSIYIVALMAFITYFPTCHVAFPVPWIHLNKKKKVAFYWYQILLPLRYLSLLLITAVTVQVVVSEMFDVWHWTVDIVLSVPISAMMWITVEKRFSFAPASVKRKER